MPAAPYRAVERTTRFYQIACNASVRALAGADANVCACPLRTVGYDGSQTNNNAGETLAIECLFDAA